MLLRFFSDPATADLGDGRTVIIDFANESLEEGGSIRAWNDEERRILPSSEMVARWSESALLAQSLALDVDAARTALSDALALADLYPAPTPEETAIIDGQVNAALASFSQLENPPADIVALAATLISWKVGLL
jgi:hypothetical protein